MTCSERFEPGQVPDPLDVIGSLPEQYPFFLDSSATGELGRYSILMRAGEETLCLDRNGNLSGPGDSVGFLDRLGQWYRAEAEPGDGPGGNGSRWPFSGGWFVYLGYELAGEIEPVLKLPASQSGLPVALAVRCEGAVVFEHGNPGRAHLVAERPEVLDVMRNELATVRGRNRGGRLPAVELRAEDGDRFKTGVERVKRYLAAGDVFQVNLSRAWRGKFESAPEALDVYGRLRKTNPAPFSGFMRWGGASLLSSSPERLVEVRGETVQTRPIAGTYPRGTDAESDAALSRQMLAHPKERAEHVMLIDLERNDLGRVCRAGSVEVSELMTVESYAHVHHIVSNVRGVLREGFTPPDVVRAVFPGGTITGCPKVRCMEIIAELEREGRGFYTGSMGYIGRDGQMDLNILIRSMLLEDDEVSLRTGAGIVSDSQPDRELAETVAKARGPLLALGAEHE